MDNMDDMDKMDATQMSIKSIASIKSIEYRNRNCKLNDSDGSYGNIYFYFQDGGMRHGFSV